MPQANPGLWDAIPLGLKGGGGSDTRPVLGSGRRETHARWCWGEAAGLETGQGGLLWGFGGQECPPSFGGDRQEMAETAGGGLLISFMRTRELRPLRRSLSRREAGSLVGSTVE